MGRPGRPITKACACFRPRLRARGPSWGGAPQAAWRPPPRGAPDRASGRSHDEDIVLDVLGPGKVFGELAVLNSSPRTATLVAIADSTTVVVDKGGFDL